jgi:hypothetical protein
LPFEAIGWFGSALLLVAYGALSLGWLRARSVAYQLGNIGGAACLAANAWSHRALPLMALEGAWAAIAIVTLAGMAWKREG